MISVMMCGPANGPMVSPMVPFKAQNLYTSCCERGPKGAVSACIPNAEKAMKRIPSKTMEVESESARELDSSLGEGWRSCEEWQEPPAYPVGGLFATFYEGN